MNEPAPSLARNRSFRRLWCGDAISLFGDWFTYVAVGALIVESGHGLLAVALLLLGHTLPRALLGPLAGRIVDRHDRRAVMIVASLARAVIVLGMIAAASVGALGVLQVLVFLRIAGSAFIDPAATAILPQLVAHEQIGRANAVLSGTWSVMFGVGVVAGGAVTTIAGPLWAMVIDAVTFVISAAVFMSLPRSRPMPPTEHARADARAGGWALASADPSILQAALGKLAAGLASGGGWVLLHHVAGVGLLGATAMGLGLLHASRAIGTGVGPLLWVRGLRASVLGLRASVALTLIGVAAFALADTPVLVLLAACVWGLGSGANWVTSSTRMQLLTPNDQLGRVAALDIVVFGLAQTLGGLLGALLADATARPQLAAWLGVGGGLLGAVIVGVLVRRAGR